MYISLQVHKKISSYKIANDIVKASQSSSYPESALPIVYGTVANENKHGVQRLGSVKTSRRTAVSKRKRSGSLSRRKSSH